MNHVNLLRQTLKPYLKWHGARLSVLASIPLRLTPTRVLAAFWLDF